MTRTPKFDLLSCLPRGLAALSATLVLSFGVGAVAAQEPAAAEPTPAATPTPVPTPIPAAEISNQAASTAAMLRAASEAQKVLEEVAAIEEVFEKEREHLEELSQETTRRLEIEGPASVLEETRKTWKRIEMRLNGWQETLTRHAGNIDGVLLQIGELQTIWELTLSSANEEGLPPEVRQQVVDTLGSIEETDRAVRSSRDAILTMQSRISRSKARVAEILDVQQEEISRRRRGIVGVDSPMLWNAFSIPGVDGGPSEQVSAMWERNAQVIQEYALENSSNLMRHLAFVIALAIVLALLRRKAALWAQQDRSLDRTVRVLDRPLSASLIITVLFGDLLHPGAPSAWIDVLGLVLLFALLRVLPLMVPRALQPIAYLLALLFFLEQAMRLAPDGNLIDRLLLLALSLTASATCWWVDRKLRDRTVIESDGWRTVTRFGSRLALGAFAVATVANIFGGVGFATLVTEGTPVSYTHLRAHET